MYTKEPSKMKSKREKSSSNSPVPILGKRKRKPTLMKQAYDEMNLSKYKKKKLEKQIMSFYSNKPDKRA